MKEDIRNWFLKPFYVWEFSAKRKIILIVLIEIFSVGFKVMYRPEMLRFPVTSHGLFYLGHGAINIIILAFFLFVLPTLFNYYFSENKRTIWRELLWIVFLFAALTNIHAVLIFIESNLSVTESIKDSLSVNLRVGVFPIIIMLLMAMVRSLEL